MRRAFNKYGSIEIESSTLKYRISIQELGVDDPIEIEKDIKRKLQTVTNENDFLLPFDIQVINRYMVLYYELSHFASLDFLREVKLHQKIPYLLSLISLAKEEEKGLKISWDRANFVCDKYENSVKAILFETDSLKVYESPTDLLQTVKNLIISTLTTLTVVINTPKRHDFIDASEENIQFVENVLRIETLDDLYMYLETLSLDIEQAISMSDTDEKPKEKSRPTLFKGKEKEVKKPKLKTSKKSSKKKTSNSSSKKKPQDKNAKMMKFGFIFVGAALLLYMISPLIVPTPKEKDKEAVVEVAIENEDGYFKGSKQLNNELVEAYRKAYNSDYEEALKLLSKINKKELNSKDVPLLIQVYDETGKLNVLLDEVPSLGNDVVTFLLTNNKLDSLPDIASKMETKNPYIEFENAHYKQDFEYMLSFIDKIEINGRKESQIIDAYLNLEKVNEARKFAEKVGNPDLIKRVEEFRN